MLYTVFFASLLEHVFVSFPFILFESQILCIIQFVHFVPILLLHFVGFFSLRRRQKGFTSCSPAKFSNFLLPPGPKKEQQSNCFSHCFYKAMLKYIRCLLLTIFIPAKDSTVSFLHFNHISRSVCETLEFHSPAASHEPSCLIILFAAATQSPFQWLPMLPVPTWNPTQAHLMRCSGKKTFCEVSSRCKSLLTTDQYCLLNYYKEL